MRSAAPRFITRHRLARLTAWARLWLAWLAAFAREWFGALPLDWVEAGLPMRRARREVALVIFLNAATRLSSRPLRPIFNPRRRNLRALMRAALGSRLRRLLRRASLAQLIDIMAAPEAHIARLARRLAQAFGARRLRLFFAADAARLMPEAHAPGRALPDTS